MTKKEAEEFDDMSTRESASESPGSSSDTSSVLSSADGDQEPASSLATAPEGESARSVEPYTALSRDLGSIRSALQECIKFMKQLEGGNRTRKRQKRQHDGTIKDLELDDGLADCERELEEAQRLLGRVEGNLRLRADLRESNAERDRLRGENEALRAKVRSSQTEMPV
ncbi:uncharacterized protein DSM5745_09801 [Aspergillus mulundensis]|uniref:Uncharacterized protein n=1 Tax=Aspergillus mulundensis TaxID=1810919 RepID=A0A3D8QRW8_9EURO|nr:hypothetical protein DSM5745_09801 [Aspergillus mulundensis]RDW64390.1 hypothetical protein DSM5745_09801 [Aspergillus mulundensis]